MEVLRKSWQFRWVYDRGNKTLGKHVVAFYCLPPNTEDENDGCHVGVVASKRVGTAVKRNRAKRLLREAVRNVAHDLIDRNMWIVLVARGGINEQAGAVVTGDLKAALSSAGLITEKQ